VRSRTRRELTYYYYSRRELPYYYYSRRELPYYYSRRELPYYYFRRELPVCSTSRDGGLAVGRSRGAATEVLPETTALLSCLPVACAHGREGRDGGQPRHAG